MPQAAAFQNQNDPKNTTSPGHRSACSVEVSPATLLPRSSVRVGLGANLVWQSEGQSLSVLGLEAPEPAEPLRSMHHSFVFV